MVDALASKTSIPDKRMTVAQWQYSALAPMDDDLFEQWLGLLEQRTGIALPLARRSFLLTSLSIRMRELGYSDYQRYYEFLTSGSPGAVEWEILVDRLTVHETRFFRDEHALALVRDELSQGENTASRSKPLHAWSVGCATGEEPYSLAMVLDDCLKKEAAGAYYAVTATDISNAALLTAREGRYHSNRVKNVPAAMLKKYFTSQDDNHYQVVQSLRERVCFTRLNLLELADAPVGLMDIIFCQNVLIYFDRALRVTVLDHLVEHLRPGGLLVLGAGEILGWSHPAMESVNYESTLAFRRRASGGGM